MAVGFRLVNNKLADLRRPATTSERAFFIIAVTVTFHFLFYLLVPVSFYSYEAGREGSLKLFAVSFQALNFILFQLAIAGAEAFYRVWRSRTLQLLDPASGLASQFCQQTLHQAVEHPRFPIEFKLIVLLKCWSFVLFYAFEMPQVTALLGLMLAVVFVFDKKGIMTFYRVDSQGLALSIVRKLLSLYSIFFTLVLGYVYILNNNRVLAEKIIAAAVTVVFLAIFVYLIWFKKKDKSINLTNSSQLLIN